MKTTHHQLTLNKPILKKLSDQSANLKKNQLKTSTVQNKQLFFLTFLNTSISYEVSTN